MVWNIVEYIVTIIEYYIYADFMVKFLKPKIKKQTILCYGLVLFFNSVITMILNHYIIFEGFLCFLRIISNFIISWFLLKGTTYEKIFASIITDTSVLLINFITLSFLSRTFEKSIAELITERGMLRITILFITKFLFFIFTRLMIKMKEKDNYTFNITEWITLSIIFITTMFIEIQLFLMSMKYHLSMKSSFAISAGVGLILINILVYILMMKISKKNEEKTSLIIDKMQLEMYKSQLYESEKQYNEIKKIRHDMKNHFQCVLALLSENENVKAQEYINDMLQNKFNFGFQYIKTQNKVVDVISNIKLSQCKDRNIKIITNISSFELDIDDIDICIILGNLFDNAIEACEKLKNECTVCFEISQRKSYVNIIIKNSVANSVIKYNPGLQTTKKDKKIHGIGLTTVKEIVEKNHGMIDFYEKNNNFIADVWLPSEKIM